MPGSRLGMTARAQRAFWPKRIAFSSSVLMPARVAQSSSPTLMPLHGGPRQHHLQPARDVRKLPDIPPCFSQPRAQPMQARPAIEYSPQI